MNNILIPSTTQIIPIIFLVDNSSLNIHEDTKARIATLEELAALMYQGFGDKKYHSWIARLNKTIEATTHNAGIKLFLGGSIVFLLKKDSSKIITDIIRNIQKFNTKGDIPCPINHVLDRANQDRPKKAYKAFRTQAKFDHWEFDLFFWGSTRINHINHTTIIIAKISLNMSVDHKSGTAAMAVRIT